jgi:hypothetical protein
VRSLARDIALGLQYFLIVVAVLLFASGEAPRFVYVVF